MNYNPNAILDTSQITDARDIPSLHSNATTIIQHIHTINIHPALILITQLMILTILTTIALTYALTSD